MLESKWPNSTHSIAGWLTSGIVQSPLPGTRHDSVSDEICCDASLWRLENIASAIRTGFLKGKHGRTNTA